MHISQRGLDLIASFEGIVLHAYNDPVRLCTVGIGHKLRDGPCRDEDYRTFGTKDNPKLTRDQAFQLLRSDVTSREAAVDRSVTVALSQNEFDALVSFVFNLGTSAFANSTLLKLLNQGRRVEAADQFLRWNKAGGQVLAGLTRRREAERALFLTPARRPAGVWVEELQRSLNRFTKKWLDGIVGPVVVDGDKGPATDRRIQEVKFYLGYGSDRTTDVIPRFVRRMRHPRNPLYSTPGLIARGIARRRKAKRAARAGLTPGVVRFDGVPCAKWMVPYLEWARRNGWQGGLVSGWRSPEYSDSLCRAMCGAPSCPGRCAGRASNHSGSSKPRGAVDVSRYDQFGALMARCPLEPRIFNALGWRDPVHFSTTGR